MGPVDTFSTGVLVLLAIVAFTNLRNGTLGDWLGAKFLNNAAPNRHPKRATTKSSTPLPATSGNAGPPGVLNNPVPGATCSQPFGGAGGHPGIDLAVPLGTRVGAAAPGKVTFAGAAGDCGLRVVVDHGGGLETRYCHLGRITTSVGATVSTGDELGEVGLTGLTTGPHLHFEVARNGSVVDPAGYVGVCAVRS